MKGNWKRLCKMEYFVSLWIFFSCFSSTTLQDYVTYFELSKPGSWAKLRTGDHLQAWKLCLPDASALSLTKFTFARDWVKPPHVFEAGITSPSELQVLQNNAGLDVLRFYAECIFLILHKKTESTKPGQQTKSENVPKKNSCLKREVLSSDGKIRLVYSCCLDLWRLAFS